jgi:hypothetical protein
MTFFAYGRYHCFLFDHLSDVILFIGLDSQTFSVGFASCLTVALAIWTSAVSRVLVAERHIGVFFNPSLPNSSPPTMSLPLLTVAALLMVSLAAGQAPVCNVDSDCVPASCCAPSTCVPVAQKPDCSATSCIGMCHPGTLDCGGSCYCSAGQCQARLNNLPTVADECSSDADCGPADCCHSKTCAARSSWPECAAVSCTFECAAGTLDCGGSCSCVSGKCLARLNGPPSVPNATSSPDAETSSNTSARDVLTGPGRQSSSAAGPCMRSASVIGLVVLALLL